MIKAILVLCLGFYVLVKGADWFVEGASSLASYFHIPQLVIGLTICAMGTSLPEASVSLVAAMHDQAGITVGNIVGSNILNILIILGITSLIARLKIQKSTFLIEIPFMLFTTVALFVMGFDQKITFYEGLILIILFIIYLIYLYILSRKNEEQEESNHSLLFCLFFIVLGIFFVMIGSHLVVQSATKLSIILGLSKRFIGLTIVAFGTSLPELVTSVLAAKKGNADIAIGNIVGSNIFNILFVIGNVSLICPIPFESHFLIDTLVALGAGAFLWICTIKHQELRRTHGFMMLAFYALYFLYLC